MQDKQIVPLKYDTQDYALVENLFFELWMQEIEEIKLILLGKNTL